MKDPIIRELPAGEDGVGAWAFHCPGCKEGHAFLKDGRWRYNGDPMRPSFSPSLVVEADGKRCHLFLTSGEITFLDDCTHELRGRSVPARPM